MMAITLSREKLGPIFHQLFYRELPGKFLFGIRGAKPTTAGGLRIEPSGDVLDVYDDAIGFMVEDGRGHCYQGSVDPGRHYTVHPLVGGGCAHVIEGAYRFCKGSHKTEPRAWKGVDVRCWRDSNRNGRYDPSESRVYVVRTSIDLHYGGRAQNSIGEYSAGCQVVCRPGWETFRDVTYDLFDYETVYWLLNVKSLQQMERDHALPSVIINDVQLSRTTPMWMSEDGQLVAIARPLLNQLRLDGGRIEFCYSPSPQPSLRFTSGAAAKGKLVQNQLVCDVRALIQAVSSDAYIRYDNNTKTLSVQSKRLTIVAAEEVIVAALEEADDDTPVND